MNLVLLLAAIIVSFLVFTWLVKVVKATIGTAIVIALVLVVLVLFGFGPQDLWNQLNDLWEGVWRSLSGSGT